MIPCDMKTSHNDFNISIKNEEKILEMLGLTPDPASSSSALLEFIIIIVLNRINLTPEQHQSTVIRVAVIKQGSFIIIMTLVQL